MNTQIRPNLLPMQLTAVIWSDPSGGFCSLNPDTGTASQGATVEEALAKLEEATTLYLEESPLTSGSPVTGAFVTTFHISDIA